MQYFDHHRLFGQGKKFLLCDKKAYEMYGIMRLCIITTILQVDMLAVTSAKYAISSYNHALLYIAYNNHLCNAPFIFKPGAH